MRVTGHRVTRRVVLRWAGYTAAFTSLAQLHPLAAFGQSASGQGVSGQSTSGPTPSPVDAPASGFFDPEQTEILTQIMERIVDTGLPDAPRVRDTQAVASVDTLCTGLDPSISGPLPLLLRAFEYAPIVFDFTFTRFSRMSDAEKDASLEAWRNSRLPLRRLAFLGLRNLCFFGWYAQPETWPLIGYRGPLIGYRGPLIDGGAS